MRGTILIVEDEAPLAAMWRRELDGRGYLVEVYDCSRDVKERLDDGNGIVAAIIDYNLADSSGSGMAVLQDLRRRQEYVDTLVIMITGSEWDPRVQDEAERLHARCVVKPAAAPATLVHSLLDARRWESMQAAIDATQAAIAELLARPCITEPKVVEIVHDHVVPALIARAPTHAVTLVGGWSRLLGAVLAGCAGVITTAYYVGAGTPLVEAAKKLFHWSP